MKFSHIIGQANAPLMLINYPSGSFQNGLDYFKLGLPVLKWVTDFKLGCDLDMYLTGLNNCDNYISYSHVCTMHNNNHIHLGT